MLDIWTPLILSFKLAIITTLFLVVIGTPLAYLMHIKKTKFNFLIEAIIGLPLVLPPTVIGFYLLVALSSNSTLGLFFEKLFNLKLIFSFSGLVIGSMIYSLPFMIQPILSGFRQLPVNFRTSAMLMNKSELQILLKVILPNIKPAFITAIALTFAHTVGEFGIVLMIGGKIPQETLVASIAIYDQVEALNYSAANFYAIILVVFSFIILSITYFLNNSYDKSQHK